MFLNGNGAPGFNCFDKSCKKTWRDLVQLFEPDTGIPSQGEDWGELQPLGGQLPQVPPFDLEMLPEALRALVGDTAERMQVPPECPAVVTVVALGTAAGGRVLIQPKRLDPAWKVFPNIWGGPVAPSGFMKSPTMAAQLSPIYEIEAVWQQDHKAAMVEYVYQKAEADLEYKEWQRTYTVSLRKKSVRPARPDAMPVAPVCRRLLTNDATKEKLQAILAENPGGTLLYRNELPGWFNQLDSFGHEGDKHIFMEMWNGAPYTVDRSRHYQR